MGQISLTAVSLRGAGRVAFATLLATACSDPPHVASPPPSIAGAAVVYDSATLSNLPYLAASLVWRTGQDSSATSIEFQAITGIAVDDTAAVYALDVGAGVRVFSWDGLLVNSFAPKGSGPAESRNPRSIAVGGDTVFVLDDQLKLFSTTGVYLDQITSQTGEFMRTLRIAYTDAGLAMQRRRFGPRSRPDAGRTKRAYEGGLEIRVKDIAHGLRQIRPTQTYLMLSYPVGALPLTGPPPLMDRVRVTVTRDARMYLPDQEHFVIEVRSADGGLLERIVGQVPRVATSNEDIEDMVQVLTITDDDATYRRYLREYRNVPRAKYRPALGDLLVSESGHVFVERRDLGELPFNPYDRRSRRVWLVIDPDWSPIGYVTLPGRFRPRVFTGCTVIGYETDDFHAHLLSRYDIGSPSNGTCRNLEPLKYERPQTSQ